MARVSDEKLATLEAPYLLGDIGTTFDVIMDLRDARALLREVYRVLSKHPWAEEECERICQLLGGHDEQS